jgi:hypothetical protein
MIAAFVAIIVVLALGKIILTSMESWEWGRDKAVLQQDVTFALEDMARSVRAAHFINMPSDSTFQTFDEESLLVHTYSKDSDRVQVDGVDLVDRDCTRFIVTPDSDTTSLTIDLELEDKVGSLVRAQTRAAVRNRHLEF